MAVAEAEGPRHGLALLDDVEMAGHRLPAVRGELLARAGDLAAARGSLTAAIALCENEVERRHLEERRDGLET